MNRPVSLALVFFFVAAPLAAEPLSRSEAVARALERHSMEGGAVKGKE